MNDHLSCLWDSVTIKHHSFTRLRYGQETRYGNGSDAYPQDHGDFYCAVAIGGLHHFGCDWEQCPRCGGQQIGCDCGRKQFR